MLGAIGAATLAAHKFWPKGVTYGEKEAWELEKDRAKDKARDVKAAITGEPRPRDRDRARARHGGGRSSGRRRGDPGDPDRDRSRERRARYLEDRARDGGRDARRLAPPTSAAAIGAATGAGGGSRRPRDDRSVRGGVGGYHHDDRRQDCYLEAPPPPPPPQRVVVPQRRLIEHQHQHQHQLPPPAPTPPPVPNPPHVYREAATVVATGARDSERGGSGRGEHYPVGRDAVVVVPSTARARGEIEYVARRDNASAVVPLPLAPAPVVVEASEWVAVERDGGRYYR